MFLASTSLHPTLAGFAGLGPPELIVIVLVVLLLFGGRKLPEVARGTGRALRIFKSETKGLMDDDDEESRDTKAAEAQQAPPQTPPQTSPQTPQQITPRPGTSAVSDPSAPPPASSTDPLPPTHTEK